MPDNHSVYLRVSIPETDSCRIPDDYGNEWNLSDSVEMIQEMCDELNETVTYHLFVIGAEEREEG
tara:strand:- start:35 stop:229 length:195 start_codon:yes stop_codon:yes gene_type:complete